MATRSWKRQGKILPWSLRRARGPADTLISDFWPLEPRGNTFLFFKPPRVWSFLPEVTGQHRRLADLGLHAGSDNDSCVTLEKSLCLSGLCSSIFPHREEEMRRVLCGST